MPQPVPTFRPCRLADALSRARWAEHARAATLYALGTWATREQLAPPPRELVA